MTSPRYPDHLRAQVDAYLETLPLVAESQAGEVPTTGTEGLVEAMRYSLLAGGKRIRPVLAMATLAHRDVQFCPPGPRCGEESKWHD